MYYIKYGHTYDALKYCLRKQLTGFWNKAVVCHLSSLDSTAASLRFHREVSALSLMNPGSKFHSCTLTMKSVSLVALEYSHIYLSATQTLSHCILTSLSILTLHSYILLDLISNSLSLSLSLSVLYSLYCLFKQLISLLSFAPLLLTYFMSEASLVQMCEDYSP